VTSDADTELVVTNLDPRNFGAVTVRTLRVPHTAVLLAFLRVAYQPRLALVEICARGVQGTRIRFGRIARCKTIYQRDALNALPARLELLIGLCWVDRIALDRAAAYTRHILIAAVDEGETVVEIARATLLRIAVPDTHAVAAQPTRALGQPIASLAREFASMFVANTLNGIDIRSNKTALRFNATALFNRVAYPRWEWLTCSASRTTGG
jgi:hypothetical protein